MRLFVAARRAVAVGRGRTRRSLESRRLRDVTGSSLPAVGPKAQSGTGELRPRGRQKAYLAAAEGLAVGEGLPVDTGPAGRRVPVAARLRGPAVDRGPRGPRPAVTPGG
ncbi:hypothetical protein SSP531S_27760 [Streptomyces spongiicola]|uniref:Uncharacterized protein n=1 Tax=Streptomyces spongiicola TaxID=1690221 RepID=A0A388SXG6_9ACTN|nr:hypothetical protein SSP531S_27760 [Streptomyces spongiicola]